jgi:hypothetical protein
LAPTRIVGKLNAPGIRANAERASVEGKIMALPSFLHRLASKSAAALRRQRQSDLYLGWQRHQRWQLRIHFLGIVVFKSAHADF